MGKDKRNSKDELSDFFKAARSASPRFNSYLKARILRDAEKIHGNLELPRNLSWFNNTPVSYTHLTLPTSDLV